MKQSILKTAFLIVLVGFGSNLSAQGFFKKLLKPKSETSKVEESSGSAENDTTTVKDKIKKSDIPAYKAQKVYVLDENNQRVKNDDGTDKYYVELIRTSDGVRVSPEMAEAQTKQINQAILAIAGKAALAAGTGFLSGGAKGALLGLAVGLGLSVNDIILIVDLKKDSNKQKKALEAYRKSFDEEGYPTVAKVDKKTIKILGMDEENAVEKTTAQIQEELSKPEYSTPAKNESIDALLEAATKA